MSYTKAKATPPGQPMIHEPMTEAEITERQAEEQAWADKQAQLAETQYLRDREREYEKQIYPYQEKAIMEANLENNTTLLDELRDKKAAIDAEYPAPE